MILRCARTLSAVVLLCAGRAAATETPLTAPPLEVVSDKIDIETAADGEYWQLRESTYRPLTEQGLDAIRRFTYSYTAGYQAFQIDQAYTTKKDGIRIDVPKENILYGNGESNITGYQANRTVTVYFSNLEIGDKITIVTFTHQIVPWFVGVFAYDLGFSRDIPVRDADIAFTAPVGMKLSIDAKGLESRPSLQGGNKLRRSWHYRSDTAVKLEDSAIDEAERQPHLRVSTLADWSEVAALHDALYMDKMTITPAIAAQADQITKGISGRRAEAEALANWVARHIKYVDIVLGAGGFTPHKADAVLKNLYGDCKDHVMLLGALLAAKGIKSSPALIQAQTMQFHLPGTPTPFQFNHLITYIPEFDQYVDSTAEYAPFGVLPFGDDGRPVLIADTGELAATPPITGTQIGAKTTLRLNRDGSADGDTTVIATGSEAAALRAAMATRSADSDEDFFRSYFGAGSTGKIDAKTDDMTRDFSFAAHYHIASFVHLPGPGAFPAALGYKPFAFTGLLGDLPEARQNPFACLSIDASEEVTLILPDNVKLSALPPPSDIAGDRVRFSEHFDTPDPHSVHELTRFDFTQPGATCTPSYYARVRPDLTAIFTALRAQVLYQ